MNDAQRRFCHLLAKAVTSSGTYTYSGESTGTSLFHFGGGPSPYDVRAAGRLSGLRASGTPGNKTQQGLLVGQAVRAVNRGKLTFGKAISKLRVSTQRRAPAVSTAAPGQALRGSGGSGTTGALPTQLGQAPTQGTYVKPPGT